MYVVYLGEVKLPVAPPKIERKIKNQNKTINLINQGEVTIPKLPGLSEISFTCMLPVNKYPFANYDNGTFRKPSYYSGHFSRLKNSKKPFNFRILRWLDMKPSESEGNVTPNGLSQYLGDSKSGTGGLGMTGLNFTIADMDFDLKVTLEDYSIIEDAKNHPDMEASIKLKEWKSYGTKVIVLKDDSAESETERESEKEAGKDYTVKSGDCFWSIAQKELGNGNRYKEIIELNKDGALKGRATGGAMNGGYLIHPGDVLKMPK